jgi:autotransporter-associated beta strand protein
MSQSGGTVEIASVLRIQQFYNLNDGLLTVAGFGGGGRFNFNGGTLQAGASFSLVGTFNSPVLTLNTPNGTGALDTSAYTVTLSGVTGLGNLIKIGSGKLILSSTNTYTGGTTVAGGTLIVTQPQALASGSDLTIGNAAAFPAPIVAGDAPPGNSPGSPVPEPTALALIAAAAITLLGYGLRRRRIAT